MSHARGIRLSLSEQHALIVKAKSPNLTESIPAQHRLWWDITPIVSYLAFVFSKTGLSHDEIQSIAYLAFIRSIKHFDTSYNNRLEAYAKKCIKQDLIEASIQLRSGSVHDDFSTQYTSDDDTEDCGEQLDKHTKEQYVAEFTEYSERLHEAIDLSVIAHELWSVIHYFSPTEQRLLHLIINEKQSDKQAAASLTVTPGRISQLRSSIKRRAQSLLPHRVVTM